MAQVSHMSHRTSRGRWKTGGMRDLLQPDDLATLLAQQPAQQPAQAPDGRHGARRALAARARRRPGGLPRRPRARPRRTSTWRPSSPTRRTTRWGRAGATRCRPPTGSRSRCGAAGVRADRPVVVYDDWSRLAAARAWWLLRHHGHPDVRVLDGGWSAWRARGGRGRDRVATPVPGDFVAVPGRLPVLDADAAARVAAEGVLSTRGRRSGSPRRAGAGRPGAPATCPGRSTSPPPPTSATAGSGRWTSSRTATPPRRARAVVGAYCGSGVTATHDLFVLHLLGARAALYAGSWSGWVVRPGAPGAKRSRKLDAPERVTAGGVGRLMFTSGGR